MTPCRRIAAPRSWLTAAAVLLSLSTFALVAAAKLSKTGASTTTFKAAGPAGLSIAGTTSDMSVADDGTTVTITVPLANVSTGISLRDKHTKDALEVDKYPNVTLAVARSATIHVLVIIAYLPISRRPASIG